MELIKFLQAFSSPLLDSFFEVVTMLGEESAYIVILGLVFWCIDKRYGYKLAFAFLFSSVVNNIAKNIFKLTRPLGIEGIRNLRVETATGYAFPSGHTQNITAFVTAIMKKLRKKSFYIIGCSIILLVATSRLYLGVHWPRDVIGGIFFGIVSVFISDYIFEYTDKTKNKYILLILVLPVGAALFIFRDHDLLKATAVFLSFIMGYLIEDKYIKFTSKAVPWKQLVKFTLGIIGALAIKTLLKPVLPELDISDFFRYFMLGIWVTVIAPYLFKLLKLSDLEIALK